MKKRLIKAGVLGVIFIIALIISSLVINRGNKDDIVGMGAPTLPRVSFLSGDQEINSLFGYVTEMDITAMRDTITPLAEDGSLTIKVEKNGNEISGVGYEVYSMDGKDKYESGEADLSKDGASAVIFPKSVPAGSGQEAVLRIILKTEDKEVSFYTRIIRPDDLSTKECLAFAQDFHTKALNKDTSSDLSEYLEPGEESDNTTYQTVNIHSDITHVMWGSMQPQVVGDVEWSIKENNTVYTSILAKYQVACSGEDGTQDVYDIKEFFRVRYMEGEVYLLDYNRDMEQVFSESDPVIDQDSIELGIASDDLQYESDEDGTKAAFVQERELWLYDAEEGKLIQAFSFADQEGQDVRSRNDQHAVRIISMDEDGSLAFAVYGYMNRGPHEGQVGVGIYYYSAKDTTVEEKAFIPSKKSFAIAEDELGKMVYYNHKQLMLYVLAEGTLYQIDLDKDKQTILAENLEEDEYAVSDDGHLMAYCKEGNEEDPGSGIQVLDLGSGDGYLIEAAKSEELRPLGFVNGDFVYGKASPEDEGITVSGDKISPMYEVEIRNSENKEEAKYNFTDQGLYTTDVLIEDNLLTLNRVQKEGEQYMAASQEYVSNNKERKETKVTLQSYSADDGNTKLQLVFSEGTKGNEYNIKKPELSVAKNPLTITLGNSSDEIRFYVYGMGELVGIYDKAGYAVQKAEQVAGVVISSDQTYVWEKGNRDLVYSTDASAFVKEGDETSLEACERYMEQYEAERIDLTGCALDQVLYVINRGCPLIVLTDMDHALLLTGYTLTDVTYIDPDDGGEYTVSMSEMESMAESGGNTFIGYIK